MVRYIDRDGDSGILAYEIGSHWILVQFKDGSVYEYTDVSAGRAQLAVMKRLAQSGDGLNRFINLHAKKGYSRRLR